MRLNDDFTPAAGLTDGHAQTLFGAIARPRVDHLFTLTSERLETPDGDFVDVERLEGRLGAPTVLILHGLEGSARSSYVRHVLLGCQRRGWHAVALNFRSCSGEPNRLAHSYSSGEWRDVAWLISLLEGPVFAIGFSLGGSVLLNLLAQHRKAVPLAAVAVSTPYDLGVCADYLDSQSTFAAVYRRNFLHTLKRKGLVKAKQFPHLIDAARVEKATTLRQFDDCVTATVFGYESAAEYYARCSTRSQLRHIEVPTLLISAEDDALAPARLLPTELPSHIDTLTTQHGGHVGFIQGSVLRPRSWVEERALEWLATTASCRRLVSQTALGPLHP